MYDLDQYQFLEKTVDDTLPTAHQIALEARRRFLAYLLRKMIEPVYGSAYEGQEEQDIGEVVQK
jgi:hypothetical protein